MSDGAKKVFFLTPKLGVNVLKLFCFITDAPENRLCVGSYKTFQPWLIFASKTAA
jgi:hypothetical protein